MSTEMDSMLEEIRKDFPEAYLVDSIIEGKQAIKCEPSVYFESNLFYIYDETGVELLALTPKVYMVGLIQDAYFKEILDNS